MSVGVCWLSQRENTCFVRVKQRHASSQLCSQLDQKNRCSCEQPHKWQRGRYLQGQKRRISYVVRSEIWNNRHIRYKYREKTNLLGLTGETLSTISAEVQRKIHNLRSRFIVFCCVYRTFFCESA
jgi:hypothetical protein